MTPSRETILAALFAKAQQSIRAEFTADTLEGSAVLSNVSSFTNLRTALPVFNGPFPEETIITGIDTDLGEVTLSSPAISSVPAAQLICGFRTAERRLKWFDEVPEQPALFMRWIGEDWPGRPSGLVAKTLIDVELWVYTRVGEAKETGGIPPSRLIGALVDAIEESLRPDPWSSRNVQDLGGLVTECEIEGRIVVDSGDLDQQGKAVIPVRLKMAGG